MIANGDQAAFDSRFRPRIEALARRRGVPSHDCQDVAQEVLSTALRQLQDGKFRVESALATWLHPIMHAGVANYFRKRGRVEAVPLEDLTPDDRAFIVAGNVHAAAEVNEALARLSTEDRLLLTLYHQHGWTLEEIGPLLGLRKSAVAERIKAAEERFRIALRDGGRTPDPNRLKD